MRSNHTLEVLRAGGAALGIWMPSSQPLTARMLAYQGCLDWLMFDGEHAPIDVSTLALCCAMTADISRGGCTPLTRVAAGTVDQIKRALDAGAQGVLVPLVNTAEQAAEVVQHAKYPPQGARGNGGLLPHMGFAASRASYSVDANSQTMVAIQIETRQAVGNIDEILAVPGIDCAFIGPNDLHISYGQPPSYWSEDPGFQGAVRAVLAACARHKVIPGILCANAAQAKLRVAEGFRFVGYGSDLALMLSAVGTGYGHITGAPEPAGGWAAAIRGNL